MLCLKMNDRTGKTKDVEAFVLRAGHNAGSVGFFLAVTIAVASFFRLFELGLSAFMGTPSCSELATRHVELARFSKQVV